MKNHLHPVKPKILVELIHDVICSWCPIGLQNIRTAMSALKHEIEFELKFLPYELNPEMPPEGEAIEAYLKRRNGWDSEQFADYANMVVEKAGAVGLEYDYAKRTHYYNTAKAHRLIDLSEQIGLQIEFVDALTQAYFQDGVDISKTENLIKLATAIGLEKTVVIDTLEAESNRKSLQAKYQRVRSLNVKSTPSLLINEQTFVQGSNSQAYFTEVFFGLASTSPKSASSAVR